MSTTLAASDFFSLLQVETIGLALFACLLWWRLRSPAVPLGLLLVYYYSLYGAWFVVADLSGGDTATFNLTYNYLFDRLFEVQLDADYYRALVLYGLFSLVVSATLLLGMRPLVWGVRRTARVRISHSRVLLICGAAALISFVLVRGQLAEASNSGLSAYVFTRTAENDPFFSIRAVLTRMALVPAALGFAVRYSGSNPRFIGSARMSKWDIVGYGSLLGAMYVISVALGNKNELLFSLLAGLLLYLVNADHPRQISSLSHLAVSECWP